MNQWVPVGLLLLAVAVGVFSNWLAPPAKLTSRAIAGIFVILVLGYMALSYYDQHRSKTTAQPPGTTPSTGQSATSSSPPAGATATTAAPWTGTGTGTGTGNGGGPGGGGPATTKGTVPDPGPQYVQAARFERFGESYGPFRFEADGTRLVIGSQPEWWELGAELSNFNSCAITLSFDMRLEAPAVVTDASYGFGVMPRGGTANDESSGGLLMIHPSEPYIAAWSTEPTPGHGGFGFDWHTIADLSTSRHFRVNASGKTHTAVIGSEQLWEDFDSVAQCGKPVFFVWGGATAYIDHILIS